jgi:hypothetical protein
MPRTKKLKAYKKYKGISKVIKKMPKKKQALILTGLMRLAGL